MDNNDALQSLPIFSQVKDVRMGFLEVAEIGAAATTKVALPLVDNAVHFAPPLIAGAQIALSAWDHRMEKKRLAHEYDAEIGARLRKPESEVTVADMEKVAQTNHVIADAVDHSRKKRNLSIGVAVVGVIAAIAIAELVVPVLAPAILASGLAGGIASVIGISAPTVATFTAGLVSGLAGFFGVEVPLHTIGEKAMKLEEPSFKSVKRNPSRQAELSVASQISYLGEMQAERKSISQEQVMTVFVSANPLLEKAIEQTYGNSFERLNADAKADAIGRFGKQFSVAEKTSDINNHFLRVQELAFAATGQSSGLHSLGSIQRENEQLRERIAQLSAQLDQHDLRPTPVRVTVTPQDPQKAAAWQQRILTERQQQAENAVSPA